MTLKQMTIDKISLLSDANVRIVLAMVNEMLRQNSETEKSGMNHKIISDKKNFEFDNDKDDVESRRAAFREIIKMRERSPFPVDFDYDKAREEAIREKYGRFN